MKTSFRNRMSLLHTWTGLLFGWILYFMFVTGTLGYLDTEIDRWMKPELPTPVLVDQPDEAVKKAVNHLQQVAALASEWTVVVPKDRTNPYLKVFWKTPDESGRQESTLHPETGAPVQARETGGGQLLYRMHWRLHYLPSIVSEWIVTVATLFMLVAIVSGVIVHKKIFSEFFTFRRKKSTRAWLDLHNLSSVTTLPFQLMITFSGLIFMMLTVLSPIVESQYGEGKEGRQKFFGEMFESMPEPSADGTPASMLPIDRLISIASGLLDAEEISLLEIHNPNRSNALIQISTRVSGTMTRSADVVTLNAITGEILGSRFREDAPGARQFRDVMLGLHEGLFAPPLVRVLYIASGLLGTLMIATGLFYWVRSRVKANSNKTDKSPIDGTSLPWKQRWLHSLNLGVVVGLPAALPLYFWANRLVPVGHLQRTEWEASALFGAWLVLIAVTFFKPNRAGIRWVCVVGMFTTGLLPLINLITTDRHFLAPGYLEDPVFAGFDLSCLIASALFALTWHLGKTPKTQAT